MMSGSFILHDLLVFSKALLDDVEVDEVGGDVDEPRTAAGLCCLVPSQPSPGLRHEPSSTGGLSCLAAS